MALSHEDVREILRVIDESELDELLIETDGFSLHVTKRSGDAPPLTPRREHGVREGASPPTDAPKPPSDPTSATTDTDGLVTILSPMLGTFYRAEAPGASPIIEIGARVQPDTTVCIIEVMKMMNSVAAGVSGVVAEVCANNAELVEYGEPLFRVRGEGTK